MKEKNEREKRGYYTFLEENLIFYIFKNNFEMGKASVNINQNSQELRYLH